MFCDSVQLFAGIVESLCGSIRLFGGTAEFIGGLVD